VVDVVLATANARYQHASLALRCLAANLSEGTTHVLVEGTIADRAIDLVERILAHGPRVVGLSVSVWNVELLSEAAALLKSAAPGVRLVVGGPEVSHEHDRQAICATADIVVVGEGEEAFARLVDDARAERPVGAHVVHGGSPKLDALRSPYVLYTAHDLQERVVYVESSRGCPFTCSFCLSALDERVRRFPQDAFLDDLRALHARGARTFKFIDRTFNVHIPSALAILDLFLEWQAHDDTRAFAHFEVVPDRLPDALKERLAQFAPGAVQLEVGVQTLDDTVSRHIARATDRAKLDDNLRFLVEKTGCHVHVDLIAGLPGEDLASFARGFDHLFAIGPHEIQVGILKRLRGTPITHDAARFGLSFSPRAPYEIVRSDAIGFDDLCRVRRFARAHDLVKNSARFPTTAPLLFVDDQEGARSPFFAFSRFAEWLHREAGALHGIALARLAEFVFRFLVEIRGHEPRAIAARLLDDYTRTGERRAPPFLLARADVDDATKKAFAALGTHGRHGPEHRADKRASDRRTARQDRAVAGG